MPKEMLKEMKNKLLTAPDGQLDATMVELVKKWDEYPTSLQILEVLDKSIYASLASGFVVSLLQLLYDTALKIENKTHEDNVPLATWRNE